MLLLVGLLGSDTTLPLDDELGPSTGCGGGGLDTVGDCGVVTNDEELATGWLVAEDAGDDRWTAFRCRTALGTGRCRDDLAALRVRTVRGLRDALAAATARDLCKLASRKCSGLGLPITGLGIAAARGADDLPLTPTIVTAAATTAARTPTAIAANAREGLRLSAGAGGGSGASSRGRSLGPCNTA